MKVAIIGLPVSGKTTVFNALTRGKAETAAWGSGRISPNQATVKVPDSRLQVLERMYRPRKVTPAEVRFVDIGGVDAPGERQAGIPPEVMSFIGTADALLVVVRSFEEATVPHPLGGLDPARDLAAVHEELILTDLLLVERRVERLEKEIPKLPLKDRPPRQMELDVLVRLREALEAERPVRDVVLSPQEEKLLRGYQLLTMKPVLVVVNLDERQIHQPVTLDYPYPRSEVVGLSARLEAELAQLEDAEAREFMAELGLETPARDLVIAAAYRLLGLISFLTVGEDEVRAWTVRQGTLAPEAGGAVHTDIQRGFIRAEVVPFEALAEAGSMAEAKRRGLVRLEGKEYVIRDGDVAHFLFNV